MLLSVFTDYGVTSYDIGTGFGHFAIATPDVSSFTRGILIVVVAMMVMLGGYVFEFAVLGVQNG